MCQRKCQTSSTQFLKCKPTTIMRFPTRRAATTKARYQNRGPFQRLPRKPQFQPRREYHLCLQSNDSTRLLCQDGVHTIAGVCHIVQVRNQFLRPGLCLRLRNQRAGEGGFSPFHHLNKYYDFIGGVNPTKATQTIKESSHHGEVCSVHHFLR